VIIHVAFSMQFISQEFSTTRIVIIKILNSIFLVATLSLAFFEDAQSAGLFWIKYLSFDSFACFSKRRLDMF